MPEPTVLSAETDDLAAVIDDALAELPERFRAAVLLCDLYKLPRAEAAARLGVPEGTLSSRLAAGRKKLADRLARRGVTAPVAGLAAALGGSAAAVPPGLAGRAATVAVAWVSGGVVPAAVRHLATGGGAGMTRAIGWAAAACAAVGLAVGAVTALPGPGPDDRGRAVAAVRPDGPGPDDPRPAERPGPADRRRPGCWAPSNYPSPAGHRCGATTAS
jgi:hypothetical protein